MPLSRVNRPTKPMTEASFGKAQSGCGLRPPCERDSFADAVAQHGCLGFAYNPVPHCRLLNASADADHLPRACGSHPFARHQQADASTIAWFRSAGRAGYRCDPARRASHAASPPTMPIFGVLMLTTAGRISRRTAQICHSATRSESTAISRFNDTCRVSTPGMDSPGGAMTTTRKPRFPRHRQDLRQELADGEHGVHAEDNRRLLH